jgi:hydroxyacylglutathione hydrolase
MPLNFAVQWAHGTPNCDHSTDPPLQTHRAGPTTFVIRQSKCSSFEAPFMYLLIGRGRSLLIDTGAPASNGDDVPLRATIDALLTPHAPPGERHPLIVAHSHAHVDHAATDHSFLQRPGTLVLGPDRADIQRQFGIARWPAGAGRLDLGGRVLAVLPVPGHEPLHLAFHDSETGALFTGDSLYPGRLVVNDWPAYRASARRLAAFARRATVSCVLGAHVEMSRTPGRLFPIGSTFQPDEHPLQLLPADLLDWTNACERLGDHPGRGEHVFPSFVIDIR